MNYNNQRQLEINNKKSKLEKWKSMKYTQQILPIDQVNDSNNWLRMHNYGFNKKKQLQQNYTSNRSVQVKPKPLGDLISFINVTETPAKNQKNDDFIKNLLQTSLQAANISHKVCISPRCKEIKNFKFKEFQQNLNQQFQKQVRQLVRKSKNAKQYRKKLAQIHLQKCGSGCMHLQYYASHFYKYKVNKRQTLKLSINHLCNIQPINHSQCPTPKIQKNKNKYKSNHNSPTNQVKFF